MKGIEEYDPDDPATMYCTMCLDENLVLKPFEVALDRMAKEMVGDEGISHQQAREKAKEKLSKLPAWKELGAGWELPDVT